MNLVVDMNLSPDWVVALAGAGHAARHWSEIGEVNATDREILVWARDNAYVVFTHDLDFGAILAATSANAPSVIQIRTQDPTPQRCHGLILDTLKQHAASLENGALISVDENRSRVRVLPLHF